MVRLFRYTMVGAVAMVATAWCPVEAQLVTSGLQIRLESDQVSVDAANRVTSWPDQSGRSHPALPNTTSTYGVPLLEVNRTPTGRPALLFTPTNKEFLEVAGTPDLDMTDGITWYVVYQTNTTNENRRQIGGGYTDIDPSATTLASYLAWGCTDGVIPSGTPTPPPLTNSFRATARNSAGTLITAPFPAESTNTTDFFIGGGVWSNAADTLTAVLVKRDYTRSTVIATGATAVPTGNAYTRIAATGGSTNPAPASANYFNGSIAAVLVYNRLLTAAEQLQVEAYLRGNYLNHKADLNHDGLVNHLDVETFMPCATGADIPYANGATCQVADIDGDGDIDQVDFGILQRCYTGDNLPPPVNCAN